MTKEIPSQSDIRAAIEKEKNRHIQGFYDHNMKRIIEVLEDFIENPSTIPSNNKVWLYIKEVGNHNLIVNRKYMFQKELKLILDNLRANGYTCWYGEKKNIEEAVV